MNKNHNALILILLVSLLTAFPSAAAVTQNTRLDAMTPRVEDLAYLDNIVPELLRKGKIPGAVIMIGNLERVFYQKAFGYRSLVPRKEPMTLDTIFDLASITKAVATATAVMQLVERDRLSLGDKAASYWPEFGIRGKRDITIRQLMTHYSGLRPDLDFTKNWQGYETAMDMITAQSPLFPPGKRLIYSDINFEILGELVSRISRKKLDVYCAENIFKPLGMKDTSFNPSAKTLERIAPTQFRRNKLLRGWVHDPTCDKMGGVAGHAGLFSTADDLAIFARALLNGGNLGNIRILKEQTVRQMTSPQSPQGKKDLRGLGWEIDPPFVSNREDLPPQGACGHTGFTGTAMWIDPVTDIYIIVLTNVVHPNGKGKVQPLREKVKEVVSKAIGPLPR